LLCHQDEWRIFGGWRIGFVNAKKKAGWLIEISQAEILNGCVCADCGF